MLLKNMFWARKMKRSQNDQRSSSALTLWPGLSLGSVYLLPAGIIWEGPKGGRRCQPIICLANLPESFALESILAERRTHHQEGPWVRPNMSQTRGLARDNPKTNPITIKPETVSHVAEQVSWVPLLCYFPSGHPFPIKPFVLSACVSTWTIHFQVLDKSPLSVPGRGPPSWKSVLGPT